MRALRTIITITAMAAAMAASPFAAAHASLKSAVPAADATVTTSPAEVALTFNEKIEPAFSSIAIADGQGNNVATDKARVDANNPAMLRLAVPALASGTYTVTWAVAGHDGHRRKGAFKFTVK